MATGLERNKHLNRPRKSEAARRADSNVVECRSKSDTDRYANRHTGPRRHTGGFPRTTAVLIFAHASPMIVSDPCSTYNGHEATGPHSDCVSSMHCRLTPALRVSVSCGRRHSSQRTVRRLRHRSPRQCWLPDPSSWYAPMSFPGPGMTGAKSPVILTARRGVKSVFALPAAGEFDLMLKSEVP